MFEWDEEKNKSNLKKHGISFEEASEIFNRQTLSELDERFNDEEREISIGELSINLIVIVVAHTERNGKIRIISARKANKKEREAYYEYIQEAT